MAATEPTLGVKHPTVVPGNPRPVDDGELEGEPVADDPADGPRSE